MAERDMFDYCLSNPPYQKLLGGRTITSIYPEFILLGSHLSQHSMMIHPARALQRAGRFHKETIDSILNNSRFAAHGETLHGETVFAGTQIQGGVIISTYAKNQDIPDGFASLIPAPLQHIAEKTRNISPVSIMHSIHNFGVHRITDYARERFATELQDVSNAAQLKTNAFHTLSVLFDVSQHMVEQGVARPEDCYTVFGLEHTKRAFKIMHKDFIHVPDNWHHTWKVFVPNSNDTAHGTIGRPQVGDGTMISTQTFLAFGMFDTQEEAINCAKYVTTRFARALLQILKITQHNAKKTWQHVPLQDFTSNADIDWSQSIQDIDAQLYAKYEIDDAEQEWIQHNIRQM